VNFDVPHLVQYIARVKHFKRMSLLDLTSIVSAGQVVHYKKGETILREDEECSGLFVLFSGEIYLCRTSPQGQMTILSAIRPIIMFNEVAVIDCGPNPYTAIAASDCTAWRVSNERFQRLMDTYPQLGMSLLKVLARRTRTLIAHCEDLTFRSVMGRTAKLLLTLSEDGTKAIDRREQNNLVLAAKVATAPEAVCRSLRLLRQEKVIICSRSWIKVNSIDRLTRYSQTGPEWPKESCDCDSRDLDEPRVSVNPQDISMN
jgi:CRP/FNR family transcriptional regulator